MKYLLMVVFFFTGYSGCLNKQTESKPMADRTNVDTVNLYENLIDTTQQDFDKDGSVSPIEWVDTIKIHAKLTVDVFSLDSVIATIELISEEKHETILLYKPLLPDKYLLENTFIVYDTTADVFSFLKFNAPKSTHDYIDKKSPGFMKTVIPKISSDVLQPIKPGEHLIFKLNLSNYYYFKGIAKKGIPFVYIGYTVNMPLIENNKQLEVKHPSLNWLRPAYFHISNVDSSYKHKNLKIFLNNVGKVSN